jgi:hypothetical protein
MNNKDNVCRDVEITTFYHQDVGMKPEELARPEAVCTCWCSAACIPVCVVYWSVTGATSDVYSISYALSQIS